MKLGFRHSQQRRLDSFRKMPVAPTTFRLGLLLAIAALWTGCSNRHCVRTRTVTSSQRYCASSYEGRCVSYGSRLVTRDVCVEYACTYGRDSDGNCADKGSASMPPPPQKDEICEDRNHARACGGSSSQTACKTWISFCDKVVFEPGRGLPNAVLGSTTPEQVRDAFGDDCEVEQYGSDLVYMTYLYTKSGRHRTDQELAKGKLPAQFTFDGGRLTQIWLTAPAFYTKDGLSVGTSIARALRELGDGYRKRSHDATDEYTFDKLGVELSVDSKTRRVEGIFLFRPK